MRGVELLRLLDRGSLALPRVVQGALLRERLPERVRVERLHVHLRVPCLGVQRPAHLHPVERSLRVVDLLLELRDVLLRDEDAAGGEEPLAREETERNPYIPVDSGVSKVKARMLAHRGAI